MIQKTTKSWVIKNIAVAGDGAKVIEAFSLVRINPCDPHHKIGEVLFTDSSLSFHFSSRFHFSFYYFFFLFCSFCFVLVFLGSFCRLSIACYIENKIQGRDWKELTLLIIFGLWSNCWENGKSMGKLTNSTRTKQWQFSHV